MCFSYRLDNDGESHPTDIAQLLFARALSDVDVEEADRVLLELAPPGLVAFDFGNREMSWRWKQRCGDDRVRCGIVAWRAYRHLSNGSSVCRRKAATIASSSIDSTVDLGSLDPIDAEIVMISESWDGSELKRTFWSLVPPGILA